MHKHTALGSSPEHFQRLGLDPHRIAGWEDGLRTSAGEGSFEWWYFDCHCEDGSKLSVEFHTKPPFVSPSKPLMPYVLLTLQRPDGTALQKALTADATQFSAARERCDVRIGANTFVGDLQRYMIHVDIEGVLLDVTLDAQVPAWRGETGHVFFGAAEEHYIAWFVAVPRGAVSGRLTVDGVSRQVCGAGYHDHNWGNCSLRRVVDHWYWGRARIGEYTVVTLMGTSREAYGKVAAPAFMLAKGSDIISSGVDNVRFRASEPSVVPSTRVPVANRLSYEYTQGDVSYEVTFVRRADNFVLDFGAAGAYQRFTGDVILRQRRDGQVEETRADALWEYLYFGPRVSAA